MLRGSAPLPFVSAQRRRLVYDSVADMAAPRRSYYAMVALSAIIASYGLLANSTAVVIGAMLVAPLMGPIFGIALGLRSGDRDLLRHGMLAELIGVLLSVGIAALIGLMPLKLAFGGEIISRTQPTLFDLLVALAAGVAGAYALVNERISPALPGVAIATALMPPLATCGLCLTTGRWEWALGAFLLFFANLLAIQLAAALVFAVFGIGADPSGVTPTWRGVLRRFGLSMVALVVMACYMTSTLTHLIADGRLQRELETALSREVGATAGARLSEVSQEREGNTLNVVATVMTPKEFEPVQVQGIERRLRSEVSAPLRLVIRSLISSDVDARGPVFVPEQDRRRLADAEEQSQFLAKASEVLDEEIRKTPGARVVSISRDQRDGRMAVTLVVRTPTPIGPEQVLAAEGVLSRAVGLPVALIVRSVHTKETTASGYVGNGEVTPKPGSALDVALTSALRMGVTHQLSLLAEGARLVAWRAERRGERVQVVATVETPHILTPEQVATIQSALRRYVYSQTDLLVQSVVGATTSADGYVTAPQMLPSPAPLSDWATPEG
jgi:uncharacterized hydrophobic protein (TIGR00271 family)